jgi:hypothetical protein
MLYLGPRSPSLLCLTRANAKSPYAGYTKGLVKKMILFMIGADICHFVLLVNAEPTLQIVKHMLSICLTFFSLCSV